MTWWRSGPSALRWGVVLLLLHLGLAVLGPFLAPYAQDQMMAGMPIEPASLAHPFGTDQMGRDIFSRTLAGGWIVIGLAVYGTLLVNAGKTFFSESFPDLWLFLMAGLFIGVTMAFPLGLAGVWEERIVPWWKGRRAALRDASASRPQPPSPPPHAPMMKQPPPSSVKLPEGTSGQSV